MLVKAWKSVNVATLTHAWKPLLPAMITSQPGTVMENRQVQRQLLADTVEVVHRIPVPGFCDMTISEIEELIGHRPQEESTEEILEEGGTEVEQQQIVEESRQQQEHILTTSAISS